MKDPGLYVLLAMLAMVNALFAFQRSKVKTKGGYVPEGLEDAPDYLPNNPFFLEGFWRGFSINLSFAAVSVVMGTKLLGLARAADWYTDPVFWGSLSFLLSIVAAFFLDDDYELTTSVARWRRIILFVLGSVALYFATAASVSGLPSTVATPDDCSSAISTGSQLIWAAGIWAASSILTFLVPWVWSRFWPNGQTDM